MALTFLAPAIARAQVIEGCWNIYSPTNERYVRRDCAGISYRADGQTATDDARFYLKTYDPDHTNRFLIYDICGSYLSSDPSGVVVRGTLPDTSSEWEVVAQGGGLFGLRSVAHNRWMETTTFLFGLRTVGSLGDEGKFNFASTQGCQPPPETIRLNIAPMGGSVLLFWALAAGGWVLEETPTLNGAPLPWTPVNLPYTTNGSTISVTKLIESGNRFYRLRRP